MKVWIWPASVLLVCAVLVLRNGSDARKSVELESKSLVKSSPTAWKSKQSQLFSFDQGNVWMYKPVKGLLQGRGVTAGVGRFSQAAMDPLNGKALLVPDPEHPGHVMLSADARMREEEYKTWLSKHPDDASWHASSLGYFDAAEDPIPTSGRIKLTSLGVNV